MNIIQLTLMTKVCIFQYLQAIEVKKAFGPC